MKTASIIAIVASAGIASAATYTFDISGFDVEGSFGDNFATLWYDFGFAGTMTNVEWDVNYVSHDPSWNSEVQIALDTDLDNSFDGDINMGDFGAPDSPGAFASTGSIVANSDSSDGVIYLTLYESFNDLSVNPDSTFGAGSTVTVTYIPAPGAAALLGLGGLVAIRRRR